MPHGKFASTNQKHHSDLGGHASSVRKFCARFSDVISWGNQWEHEKTVDVAMPTNDPKETLFTLLCRLNFLFSGGNVLTEISVPFVETHI